MWFVQNFKHFYGTENVIYCVHNLIHLADDVETFKAPLDDFSCFPFENEMKNIKKYLRKHDKPLAQIFRRLSERTATFNIKELKKDTYPLLIKKSITKLNIPFDHEYFYEGIAFEKFTLRTTRPNNICYVKDGSVYNIKYIIISKMKVFCVGYKIITADVPLYPLESHKLHVYVYD